MKGKRRLIAVMLTLCVTLVPLHVDAKRYHTVGIGANGDADAPSFTLELGKKDLSWLGGNWLLAGGLTTIYHGDGNVPEETIGSRAPHSDVTAQGDRDDGTEPGLYLKVGRQIPAKRVYVTALVGSSLVERVELVRSNPTQVYYAQSTDQAFELLLGVGLSWFPKPFFDWELKMNFQAGYDIRRGVTVDVGWCW